MAICQTSSFSKLSYSIRFSVSHIAYRISLLNRRQRSRLLVYVFKPAAHVEGLLGDVVEISGEDFFEGLDRVRNWNEFAGVAGELFGNEVRLRKKSFDSSRAADDEFVVIGKLVDPENSDDVLQFAVTLKDLL